MMTEVEQETRQLPCLIESFYEFTEGLPTPDMFRRWAGITLVSGALSRRCWMRTRVGAIYPNLLVWLVGPPGVGKGVVINPVSDIWTATHKLRCAPTSMTKAAFVDNLQSAGKLDVKLNENIHSLLIPSPELGTLFVDNDLEFFNTINDIYDNRKIYEESRRHVRNGETLRIEYPNITMLGGTQPKYMGALLPDAAYGMGLMSRVILIYAPTSPMQDFFGEGVYDEKLFNAIVHDTRLLTERVGLLDWSVPAMAEFEAWRRAGGKPRPTASRLQSYNARRPVHLSKVAMCYAASRGHEDVELVDYESALEALIEAEAIMPEVFAEMLGDADYQIVEAIYDWIYQYYIAKGKGIRESELLGYITKRAGVMKSSYLMDNIVASGVVIPDPTMPAQEGCRIFLPGEAPTKMV